MLPGRFSTVKVEEDRIILGCDECQSRLSKPSDHFVYFWLQRCDDYFLIAGTAGYRQITSVGTHKGIVHEFDQEVVYVDCEVEWEQTFLESFIGPMDPFTRTLAVRFMNQDDSHYVKRRGTPAFDIFMRSPVRQTRSHARLKSKKVATLRLRWVD